MLFMPERTLDTPPHSTQKRKAHSAGLLLTGDSSKTEIIPEDLLSKFPPFKGSITTTPIPYRQAYFNFISSLEIVIQ